MNTLFDFVLGILVISASVEYDPHLVNSLPDYPYSKCRLYSGYLSLKDTIKKYHYIFQVAESTGDATPWTKPLVLWLNGGPGCSSLNGWISQHGPVKLGEDGKFELNEYNWNKEANMLYLESPGNVGFSYIDSDKEAKLEINDEITTQENLEALIDFFTKYPSFKKNTLYLSGEEYAGIHIPSLANAILVYNQGLPNDQMIHLNGFMIGNPITDWKYDSIPAVFDFAYEHSFYSTEMRKDYINYCLYKPNNHKCDIISQKIFFLFNNINRYDILQDCGSRTNSYNSFKRNHNLLYANAKWAYPSYYQSQSQTVIDALYYQSNNANKNEKVCYDTSQSESYLNRLDVKQALHVNENINWSFCSKTVADRYKINTIGSIHLYSKLLTSGLRIMIYSGDTDMLVPFNGTQKWIKSLRLDIQSKWRSWRAFKDNFNISGYRTIYNGLLFVTVKGVGQKVPQWKPKEAFYIFSQFLKRNDL